MAALFTVTEAKNLLGIQDEDSGRDLRLGSVIEAVTSVVEARVGWVALRQVELDVPGHGRSAAVLEGANVREVVSGTNIRTGAAVDVTGMYVDTSGILRRTNGASLPAEPWRLTLLVGYETVPNNIVEGAKEILREAWETNESRVGASDVRPFLVSYRAAAWLEGSEDLGGFA